MTQSRTYKRVMNEITASDVISESSINALKKAELNLQRLEQGYSVGVTASKLSEVELDAIHSYLSAHPKKVSDTQAVKGLVWLRKLHLTPLGKVKSNSPFSKRQASIFLDNFSHFEFCGVQYGLPQYKVVAKDGDHFKYEPCPWQRGSQPITFIF